MKPQLDPFIDKWAVGAGLKPARLSRKTGRFETVPYNRSIRLGPKGCGGFIVLSNPMEDPV